MKRQATAIQTIRLYYLKPSEFVARLGNKPTGIDALLPDDKTQRIVIRGERSAVAMLVQMAAMIDVRPRLVKLDVRLLRYGPKELKGTPLAQQLIVVGNNMPGVVHLKSVNELCQVTFTPHDDAKGTIGLTVALRAKLGLTMSEMSTFRKAPAGKLFPVAVLNPKEAYPNSKVDLWWPHRSDPQSTREQLRVIEVIATEVK